MHEGSLARPIQVATTADGTLTYLVDLPPEALPPVRPRDLDAAWHAARQAAMRQDWGTARLFRFRRPDGECTDIALADADASCWADAVDGSVGLRHPYGLSLCLRLLALVDLLVRARWADGLFTLRRDGAELHPALLREAAETTLAEDARFDAEALRARLGSLPACRALLPAASWTAEPRLPPGVAA